MEKQEDLKNINEPGFSLSGFLSYKNPNAEEYKQLINAEVARTARVKERSGLEPPVDIYSEHWLNKIFAYTHKELLDYIHQKLLGEILIDLGGGKKPNMKIVAKESGVKIYVNVEKFLPDNLAIKTQKEENTEIIFTKNDILDFISRVPDNSANFTVNGIDTLVIASPKYHSALAQEISRATKVGGIVFGINSDALWELPKDRFRDVAAAQKVYREDIKVFEKIK